MIVGFFLTGGSKNRKLAEAGVRWHAPEMHLPVKAQQDG